MECNIQITLNETQDQQDAPIEVDTFMVCVYENDGDGTPLIEYHEELDVSNTALELLLCDELEELGISIHDCEIIRDY